MTTSGESVHGAQIDQAERLPIAVIGCRVFRDLLDAHLPGSLVDSVTFLDYGLHRWPAKLHEAVQAQIDGLVTPSLVVLGYGLCGNGLDGIEARQHTLLIPRADDCITVLLGSRSRYVEEFETEPGTYYLTKGWLELGSHPLNEFREYEARYGLENAQWIMDQQYQHYRRLVFVAHSHRELATYRAQAQEVGEFCAQWGMRYEEILGSELFVERLARAALHPDAIDSDFLLVPPGGQIQQAEFLRQPAAGSDPAPLGLLRPTQTDQRSAAVPPPS